MPELTLIAKKPVTDRISAFVFEGESLAGYAAGAHVNFELGASGTRSYSLIDWIAAPSEPRAYTVAIQREDAGDGGSKAMHALEVGAKLNASEPKNDFELRPSDRPALLLAGGIGITPMISHAGDLAGQNRPFALCYTGRSHGVMAFADRLIEKFGATIYTDDADPLDLAKLMAAHKGHDLYICGPRPMIDAARAAAVAAGLPEDRIFIELFATPETTGDAPFEVEINDGQTFTIPAGSTIIEVLEEAGVDVMYDCQRGDCGICQTDVIEGTPDHRDVVLSDAEKASGKVMQICVSRAKSERLKLDI